MIFSKANKKIVLLKLNVVKLEMAAQVHLSKKEIEAFKKKIEALDEVIDAIDLCDEHAVPTDYVDDLEDFKERLCVHLDKIICGGSPKSMIDHAMVKSAKEDKKKRENLIKVLLSLRDIFKGEDGDDSSAHRKEFLEGLLKTEGTTENILVDCLDRIRHLQSGKMVFMVAGETSAGKSSVLNLLFGKDVLPTDMRSATVVPTVIQYGKRKSAKVVYKTGHVEEIPMLDQAGIRRLKEVTFIEDTSKREYHNLYEVQVFLPLTILKSGLVLVDTPGVGENEFLEESVANYIGKNKIHGFIYIIMSDNAGGVQEDRLLKLLQVVLKQQQGDAVGTSSLLKFDPSSALFIGNRFDLVPKADRGLVQDNAAKQLSLYWPKFEEKQLTFLSTYKANQLLEIDHDYINRDYREFLEKLRDIFFSAMEGNITTTYKWLENVLRRCRHHLKCMVQKLDMSEGALKEKSQQARERLQALKANTNVVIRQLEADLQVELENVCKKAGQYLEKPQAKHRLTLWTEGDLSCFEVLKGEWAWLNGQIEDAINDRLSMLLEEWEKEEKLIEKLENKMTNEIKSKLSLLETELDEIERAIEDDPEVKIRADRRDSSASASVRRRHFSGTKLRLSDVSREQHQSSYPTKVVTRIFSPFKKMKDRSKEDDFNKDPTKFMKKKAAKMMKCLLKTDGEDNLLADLVKQLMQHPFEMLEALKKKIPNFIKTNEELVMRFEKHRREEMQYQANYEDMMRELEELRSKLKEIGEGYIFVDDFRRNEIRLSQATSEGPGLSTTFRASDIFPTGSSNDQQDDVCFRGLWTSILNGQLCRQGEYKSIAIKVYLASSGVNETCQEVAKLRCLFHSEHHIADFLGIHHTDCPLPAFVYEGPLLSLRMYQRTTKCSPHQLRRIVLHTGEALEYLHGKGLVHMELTRDTLTVNSAGEVKITGACLPREAKLPLDTETTKCGDFVYIAPEVLKGELYVSCADVYSFGLLLLKLGGRRVYRDQRSWYINNFVTDIDPILMLKLETDSGVFSEHVHRAIVASVSKDMTARPDMGLFMKIVRDCHNLFKQTAENCPEPEPARMQNQETFR